MLAIISMRITVVEFDITVDKRLCISCITLLIKILDYIEVHAVKLLVKGAGVCLIMLLLTVIIERGGDAQIPHIAVETQFVVRGNPQIIQAGFLVGSKEIVGRLKILHSIGRNLGFLIAVLDVGITAQFPCVHRIVHVIVDTGIRTRSDTIIVREAMLLAVF